MNLILLRPDEVSSDGIVILRDTRARHVRVVLRASVGQEVRIGLLDGPTGLGTVKTIDTQQVVLDCCFGATPPRPRVDLLLALPRPKVLNRLWAQVAALGVGRILLTNAERVERAYFDTHVLSPDHSRAQLIEGLQQARDSHLPLVSIHRQLKVLIEDHLERLAGDHVRLLADPGAPLTIQAALHTRSSADRHFQKPPPSRVLLAVGPEGGWNDFERQLFVSRGFLPVGMGHRTLRTDTACIALLALVHAALEGGASGSAAPNRLDGDANDLLP